MVVPHMEFLDIKASLYNLPVNIPFYSSKYEVVEEIGEGTFGKVFEVRERYPANYNHGIKRTFAMKQVYIWNADTIEECRLLQKIKLLEQQNGDSEHCVKIFCWDDFYRCLFFPKLGISLTKFKEMAGIYSLENIRDIGKQILAAVGFLHQEGIVHTDLHGGNIMFVESNNYVEKDGYKYLTSSKVQLIDFSNAIDTNYYPNYNNMEIIQISSHRAPEVTLQLGWGKPAELFSIGCILFELFTGARLFHLIDALHKEAQSLAIMQKVLGQFPLCMRNYSPYSAKFFDEHGFVIYTGRAKDIIQNKKKLEEYHKEKTPDSSLLFDLLRKLLNLAPSQRIPIGDAIQHEFFEETWTITVEIPISPPAPDR